MNSCLCKRNIKKLVGKNVIAIKKDGAKVIGKLVKIKGNQVFIKPKTNKNKASTKALIPLVLYSLSALGRPGGFFGNPGGFGAGPTGVNPYGAGYNPYGAGAYPFGGTGRVPYGGVGATPFGGRFPYGTGYPGGFL